MQAAFFRIVTFVFNWVNTLSQRQEWYVVAAWIIIGLLADEVWARVGGGGSYGGGRSSGGGSRSGGGGSRSSGGSSRGGGGGGGGSIAGILIILLIILIIWIIIKKASKNARNFNVGVVSNYNPGQAWGLLRRFDPNFSEIIFTDFCYALYARAQHERAGNLDLLSPYLSDSARNVLRQRNPPGLQEVAGIIVGSMQVVGVRGLDTPMVNILVAFETNYTEITAQNRAQGGMTYYVREQWEFERRRDVLSPRPDVATALHCPRCGAALMKDTNGACAFCGAKIEAGDFQWFVRGITMLGQEARGPLLTSSVEEVGTDLPDMIQPGFEVARQHFETANPTFQWSEFMNRATLIFNELQAAWSSLDWERARPHETDSIFGMHRYWIEAYKKQGLRNVLDNCQIRRMRPVKIMCDAFYDGITLRIAAQGNDYTVNDKTRQIVTGSNTKVRSWTEYWTFVRYRNATASKARNGLNCPNCGAPLKVNSTGICEYCHGKITSGEFDWVLSKIEQDESYQG